MANTVTISEANVSKAIRDFLDAKRVMWFRMNASAQVLSYTNKLGETKRRMLRGHRPGTADLLALVTWWCPMELKNGVKMIPIPAPCFIEVKRPGGKQSDAQKQFQREAEAANCAYLLADSVDVVMDWFKSRGL